MLPTHVDAPEAPFAQNCKLIQDAFRDVVGIGDGDAGET